MAYASGVAKVIMNTRDRSGCNVLESVEALFLRPKIEIHRKYRPQHLPLGSAKCVTDTWNEQQGYVTWEVRNVYGSVSLK
jgi:hypothetical protein